MKGMHAYAAAERDVVVPSYNMTGTTGGKSNPFDGWGPILDKYSAVAGTRGMRRNPFVCPNTLDLPGMTEGQTGHDPRNPQGWMEWPCVITVSQIFPTTIPQRGFLNILRVAYWINAENPVGAPRDSLPGEFFSASVGYGPDANGHFIGPNRFGQFKRPAQLIALADGLYAGNQEVPRPGDRDTRIGYRHPISGGPPQTNIAFADGHAAAMRGDRFPRKYEEGMNRDEIREENLGSNPTVYADPAESLK